MRDPDSDWVNLGTYRIMVHDRRRVGVYISPGKHGRQFRDAYFKRREPCPIAVVCGMDPLLFIAPSPQIPHAVSEYDWAGGIRGEPREGGKGTAFRPPLPARAAADPPGLRHHARHAPQRPCH